MNEKRYLIVCLTLLTALIVLERPKTYLFEPDEARYAEISREMLATGDFISPRQNGSLYMEKPPLLYWLNAASIKIFGENPYAARLPSRLAALGTVLLLILMLSSPEAPMWGWWSGLIYTASLLPFALSRVNITDGLLTFTLSLAFLCLWRWGEAISKNKPRWGWEIGIGLGCALSVLTKGLIGIVFPGAVFVLWMIARQEWRLIPKLCFSIALPVFVIVAVPWFVLVQKANPEFFNFFFINEHIRRFTTTIHHRQEPFYFFIFFFTVGFLPWTVPFFMRMWNLWHQGRESLKSSDLFFLIWCLFILVFFSFSHSKLIPYILPALPGAAAFLARGLLTDDNALKKVFLPTALLISLVIIAAYGIAYHEHLEERYSEVALGFVPLVLAFLFIWMAHHYRSDTKKAFLWLSLSWSGLGISALILLPPVSKNYSTAPLISTALEQNPDDIINYKCYPETTSWILKRPVPVVDFVGELASIGPKDAALFWPTDKFWSEWRSPRRLAVLLRKEEQPNFEFKVGHPVTILAQNNRHLLVTNFSTVEDVMPAKAGIQVLTQHSAEGLQTGFPLTRE